MKPYKAKGSELKAGDWFYYDTGLTKVGGDNARVVVRDFDTAYLGIMNERHEIIRRPNRDSQSWLSQRDVVVVEGPDVTREEAMAAVARRTIADVPFGEPVRLRGYEGEFYRKKPMMLLSEPIPVFRVSDGVIMSVPYNTEVIDEAPSSQVVPCRCSRPR